MLNWRALWNDPIDDPILKPDLPPWIIQHKDSLQMQVTVDCVAVALSLLISVAEVDPKQENALAAVNTVMYAYMKHISDKAHEAADTVPDNDDIEAAQDTLQRNMIIGLFLIAYSGFADYAKLRRDAVRSKHPEMSERQLRDVWTARDNGFCCGSHVAEKVVMELAMELPDLNVDSFTINLGDFGGHHDDDD